METIKLTKKALSDIIRWSKTRYNDYLGFGTKREAVLSAYHSLITGHKVEVSVYTRNTKFYKKGDIVLHPKPGIETFKIECASPCGERPTNGSGGARMWGTSESGSEYHIDCINKTITCGGKVFKFLCPETTL